MQLPVPSSFDLIMYSTRPPRMPRSTLWRAQRFDAWRQPGGVDAYLGKPLSRRKRTRTRIQTSLDPATKMKQALNDRNTGENVTTL